MLGSRMDRRLVTVAFLATLALAACSSSGDTAEEDGPVADTAASTAGTNAATGSTTGTFPDVRNSETVLDPGTYTTTTFQPPLTMTFDDPWTIADQGPTDLELNEGTLAGIDKSLTIFTYFDTVVDPEDDRSLVETDDPIDWLGQNPHVVVDGEPTTMRIGGTRARQIDFHAADPPPCAYWQDGSRCWNLMPIIDGNPFTPENHELGTIYVAGTHPDEPDVPLSYRLAYGVFDGQGIVFIWQDDPDTFEETVRSFDDALATVEVG